MKVKMKKLMPLLIFHIFLLGLMVIGGSSQFFCQDKEYWCKFVKHDLSQCKKYPCIANICKNLVETASSHLPFLHLPFLLRNVRFHAQLAADA